MVGRGEGRGEETNVRRGGERREAGVDGQGHAQHATATLGHHSSPTTNVFEASRPAYALGVEDDPVARKCRRPTDESAHARGWVEPVQSKRRRTAGGSAVELRYEQRTVSQPLDAVATRAAGHHDLIRRRGSILPSNADELAARKVRDV